MRFPRVRPPSHLPYSSPSTIVATSQIDVDFLLHRHCSSSSVATLRQNPLPLCLQPKSFHFSLVVVTSSPSLSSLRLQLHHRHKEEREKEGSQVGCSVFSSWIHTRSLFRKYSLTSNLDRTRIQLQTQPVFSKTCPIQSQSESTQASSQPCLT